MPSYCYEDTGAERPGPPYRNGRPQSPAATTPSWSWPRPSPIRTIATLWRALTRLESANIPTYLADEPAKATEGSWGGGLRKCVRRRLSSRLTPFFTRGSLTLTWPRRQRRVLQRKIPIGAPLRPELPLYLPRQNNRDRQITHLGVQNPVVIPLLTQIRELVA